MLLAFLVVIQIGPDPKKGKYSDLVQDIREGKVQGIVLEENKATITYKDKQQKEQYVYIPDTQTFMNLVSSYIEDNSLEFESIDTPAPPWWLSIIPTLAVILIFVLFWIFFLQQ